MLALLLLSLYPQDYSSAVNELDFHETWEMLKQEN